MNSPLCGLVSVAAISVEDWGTSVEHRRCEHRGAEGAEERRVWVDGVFFPTGVGVWSPEIFFRFFSSKGRVLAHSGCYFCS